MRLCFQAFNQIADEIFISITFTATKPMIQMCHDDGLRAEKYGAFGIQLDNGSKQRNAVRPA